MAGFGLTLSLVEVGAGKLPTVAQLAMKLATSTEPKPVTRSNPVPTEYPASPPARPVGEGVLLLHMLGVLSEQLATPLDAMVTSWKTLLKFAASR